MTVRNFMRAVADNVVVRIEGISDGEFKTIFKGCTPVEVPDDINEKHVLWIYPDWQNGAINIVLQV